MAASAHLLALAHGLQAATCTLPDLAFAAGSTLMCWLGEAAAYPGLAVIATPAAAIPAPNSEEMKVDDRSLLFTGVIPLHR